MLLALSQWLAQDIRFFNVFTYITLRAVLATLTALSIGMMFGPAVIRRLTAMKIGQAVRTDADHGWRARPRVDRRGDPALVRSDESFRLGRVARHLRIWLDRLGR